MSDEKDLRTRTRALCAQFPDEYWRETDLGRRYPHEFVDTLTAAGLLSALIPTEYGGLGLGLSDASVIMEEVNKSGGHSAACHAQMYTMGALLRHGSDFLKNTYLPLVAKGELRLQAFCTKWPRSTTTSSRPSSPRRCSGFPARTDRMPRRRRWASHPPHGAREPRGGAPQVVTVDGAAGTVTIDEPAVIRGSGRTRSRPACR
jgi:alkylation response protein AidB-like acyl-CoA dehydrogenase